MKQSCTCTDAHSKPAAARSSPVVFYARTPNGSFHRNHFVRNSAVPAFKLSNTVSSCNLQQLVGFQPGEPFACAHTACLGDGPPQRIRSLRKQSTTG
eukprot:6177447-Pleurochrysis_carterae.AAC.4